MSDFIGRVAARAVGDRAAAAPRVPSLFEAPGAAAGAGIEVIDEEVVVPTPNRAAPVAQRHLSESRAPSAAPPPRLGEGPVTRDETDAAAPDDPPAVPSRRPPREAGERTPPPVDAVRPAAPLRTEHDERAPAAVAVVAPMLTPAVPVVARAPAHAVPVPTAAAPAEPPAVRVHIGRLEVRANLQQQPARPERIAAARSQELSLSDYLRGRRDSR